MSALASKPRPGQVTAWKLAMRLPTLPAAIAPVAVGTGVAIHVDGFRLGPAIAALIGALALQIGANFANDVFDFRKGVDTADRLGPPRATQMGLLSERQVLAGMCLAFAVATAAGVYLVVIAGWPVVAIGVASIVAAVAYTGGPWPFGYHALGDLFTFVFFGLVAVGGTVYVQVGDIPGIGWVAAGAMGCTVTMILVVNNLRDIPTDRVSGKTTLGVMLGDKGTRAWYAVLATTAYVLAVISAVAVGPTVLLAVLSIAFLLTPLRGVLRGTEGRLLNPVLKATARWHLVFGILLALGIALA